MDARPAEQLGRLLDEGVVAHAHDAVGIRLRDVREEGVDVLIVQKRAVERIRNPLAAGAQSRHERVGGLAAAHDGARPDGGAGAFSPQAQVLGEPCRQGARPRAGQRALVVRDAEVARLRLAVPHQNQRLAHDVLPSSRVRLPPV